MVLCKCSIFKIMFVNLLHIFCYPEFHSGVFFAHRCISPFRRLCVRCFMESCTSFCSWGSTYQCILNFFITWGFISGPLLSIWHFTLQDDAISNLHTVDLSILRYNSLLPMSNKFFLIDLSHLQDDAILTLSLIFCGLRKFAATGVSSSVFLPSLLLQSLGIYQLSSQTLTLPLKLWSIFC